MKVVFFLNIVSPHQLPLAREVVRKVGEDNFKYVYAETFHTDRARMGWNANELPKWCVHAGVDTPVLLEADIVYTGIRCLDLIEKRCTMGKKTFYCSERWFKPPMGILRKLDPRYFKMVRRFVHLTKTNPCLHILPIGVHARHDFSLMGIPQSKMTTWGYFVAPSSQRNQTIKQSNNSLKVLWVGRMLKLKNVDILIRAVARANQTIKQSNNQTISLTLVGDGPEKTKLETMSRGMTHVSFMPSVKIDEVRRLMQTHNVYVFPSNGYDGWGAVVSEAMEEGMLVLGSNQAGAPATMLPPSHRFNCRDYKRLSALLLNAVNDRLSCITIGDWTAATAAERLLAL